ncbi:MAG: hypothetical protein RLZZ562_409 [Planctomycetota bacterium]|jgi:hypothetical protein
MNNNLLNILAVGIAAALSTACAAGPHQLARTVDDWDNRLYVQTPVMNGVLHVVLVIPLLTVCAKVGDFCITDAACFWFDDAWDGHGTGFQHLKVEPTDGQMQSLLIEGSGWMAIQDK